MADSLITVMNNLYMITFFWAGFLLAWGVYLGIFLHNVIRVAEQSHGQTCHGKRLYLNFIWATNIGLAVLLLTSPFLFGNCVDAILVIDVFLTSSLICCSRHINAWWEEHKKVSATTSAEISS